MPAACRLGQPQSLDDVLLYRLSRLLASAGGMVIRICEGSFGITRREWTLIALLARKDELLSSELARRAQLDRARTSRAITSLVGKKLLRRHARPADRRQAALALTDSGRALYQSLYPLVLDLNRELLAALPAPAVEGLDQALQALQARAVTLAAQAELPKADRRRGRVPQRMGGR